MASGIKWEVIEVAITCKMCGTANNDGVKFCSACGSELPKGDSAGTRNGKPKVQKAKTIIMGTHETDIAAFASRRLTMKDGRIAKVD